MGGGGQARRIGLGGKEEEAGFGDFIRGDLPKKLALLLVGQCGEGGGGCLSSRDTRWQ